MKTLTNLAVSNDRSNKTRSILIIISIILTTVLLTVIATWGYGILKTNRINADKLYGSFYGNFKGVTEAQLKEMNLRSEFSDIGKMAYVGKVESNSNMYIYAADKVTRRLTNMEGQLQEGTYPSDPNKIAAQKAFFQNLGYSNPKVGDTVTLNYRTDSNSKFVSDKFIISGILKKSENDNLKATYVSYVSESFYEHLTSEKNRQYNVYFRLDDSIDINYDTAKNVLNNLAKKCGIDTKNLSVNTYYMLWAFNPGTETITVCAVVIVLVILFSIIVIYNIFQVGITQKIWEYGKLKALGATKKQLKSVILKEGLILEAIGIPIGLIFGYIISYMSFKWLMNQMGTVKAGSGLEQVSLFSLPILLLVAVLSFFTVWIALKKPIKIVTSVSTVEAMRYQEGSKNKKGIRKGKKSINVIGLTFANLSGSKKRTAATILTMGLSCVLFVILANFVGNMDEEYAARRTVEHGQFFIDLEYSLTDTAYPENNLDNILKKNPLNSDILNAIKSLKGVTDVTTRKVFAVQNKNKLMAVSVLNREDFEKNYKAGSTLGSFNYNTASEKNALIFGWSNFMENTYGYSLNQIITMQIGDGDKKIEFHAPLQGAFGSLKTEFAITEDTFQKLGLEGNFTGYIWVDCNQKDMELVQSELKELLSGMDHVNLSTYKNELQTIRLSMKMMKLGIYAFLSIIGLIGFMNMANTMITSIITRKQEFGVLQAVGMTNKQLNYMFQIDGLIFTVGTILVALLIGTPVGYGLFLYGKQHGWIGMNVYHFPIPEVGIMIAAIMILQLTLSFILSRNIKKDSLVDRIRYQG